MQRAIATVCFLLAATASADERYMCLPADIDGGTAMAVATD